MTAQIINLAERRQARQYADQSAIGLLWPGIFFGCAMFWICVGAAVMRLGPYVLAAHGTPPAHG